MIKKVMCANLTDHGVSHPVAMFVQVANQFDSRIYVETDTARINAKSILGMMTLGLNNGENLTVTAEGEDEDLAMENLRNFLTGK